jgi:hypothetical protein
MGMGKIGQIFELSNRIKYIKVKLKDGRTIKCKADCFGETELEVDGKTIPDLRVILDDGTSDILINDDVEEVLD